LNWKFWQKKSGPKKTVLSVTHQTLTDASQFYVETDDSEKAFELMEKLRKREAES
jgi:hypothetical protein